MADNNGDAKGVRRFKSKWGKVFKENDSPPALSGKVNSFKLNEDVVDFLKPSTEKGTRPKINIAVAQRWPDAQEVRRASETNTPASSQSTGFVATKPKRRQGLTVGFVKTAPEIIGEGGDEAQDPVSEISRQRAVMPRSVSARQPNPLGDGTQWPGTQAPREPPRQAQPPNHTQDDFRPQPVRRVQTSHNEFSPAMQRKHATPPLEEMPPHRPSITRTPTGFGSQTEPLDHDEHEYDSPEAPSQLHTSFNQPENGSPFVSGPALQHVPSPREPPSPAVLKQRDQRQNEGIALRRASALYLTDEVESSLRESASTGVEPSSEFYNVLSQPSAPDLLPKVADLPPHKSLSPDSALSPESPSPFADPKYIKRRSGEVAATQPPSNIPQSTKEPRNISQPSYMQIYHTSSQELTGRTARPIEQPSYMQQPAPTDTRQRTNDEKPSYMRAIEPPASSMIPSRPAPLPASNMSVPQDSSRDRSRSPMRDRIFDSQPAPEKPRPFYSQPNHSSGSLNRFPPPSPRFGHARSDSRDSMSPSKQSSTSPEYRSAPQPRNYVHTDSPQSASPRSSMLGPGNPMKPSLSPNPQGLAPADYFSAPRTASGAPARSPAANLRQEEASRPGSSGSQRSFHRGPPTPQPPAQGDPAADNAFADFAARVAHMKGVFRLTAEKQRPTDKCTPSAWLKAALWWYLRGKAGLETMLQQRPRSLEGQRELLAQPHVNLAKAWWILSDPLEPYSSVDANSPQSAQSSDGSDIQLQRSVAILRSYLKSLSLQMVRNQLMPPHQSLIQGQDTQIWLEYPRFTTDAAAVLGGNVSTSRIIETAAHTVEPLDALPLGDTRSYFCYGRFPVEVSVNTDDAESDRVVLPCLLSMLRGTRDYQTTIVISSQSPLVNVTVGPRQSGERGSSWQDASWKANSHTLAIHLPRGFDLTVRMQERDFGSLWNLAEYGRKVELSLRPESDEKRVHDARLAEVQYADSSGSRAFPTEKVKGCAGLVYERLIERRDASGVRKMHSCYRLLLVTDPGHKSLSSVSHELCKGTPLFFEMITDAAASGTTAMVIRIREDNRQLRILLVFPDASSRQAMYDVLNGLTVGPDESIVGKMTVTGVSIQPVLHTDTPTSASPSALRSLQWQKLGVTNGTSDDPNSRFPDTVESESLRILARHAAGCITDRLNLGKGELLLRIPCAETATPAVQILRGPQRDLTMSADTRILPQSVTDGISDLLRLAKQEATIRTFTFASPADLHAFQAAITGFTVTYDGVASSFGISRRMMVVPIHHKWQASKVRLQVVMKSSIVQVLAFMEDFSHADAMCFQVKSTDTFESVKGDSKGKKWAIKMKDAKFSLPRTSGSGGGGGGKGKEDEVDNEERVRKRFVNLEGLDYAEEHDDITIGFDTEEGRDRFAQALPAATTVGRMITLKRRI